MVFLLQFVLCVLLIDLLGGFFHWLEDTYGDAAWPVIGPYIIAPNIEHHVRPMSFTRSTFLARNQITIAVALLFALLSYLAGVQLLAWYLALAVGSMANQIHFYTHIKTRDVPPAIRWLQRLRILQTQAHHVGGHHGQPFDARYCVITNVVNPVVDALQLWRGLEFGVWLFTGIQPRGRSLFSADSFE